MKAGGFHLFLRRSNLLAASLTGLVTNSPFKAWSTIAAASIFTATPERIPEQSQATSRPYPEAHLLRRHASNPSGAVGPRAISFPKRPVARAIQWLVFEPFHYLKKRTPPSKCPGPNLRRSARWYSLYISSAGWRLPGQSQRKQDL